MALLQRLSLLMVLVMWLCAARAAASDVQVTLRSVALLPETTVDQRGESFAISGLSGITHIGGGDFIAVMDNSDKLVKLRMEFDEQGQLLSVECTGGVTLSERRDFEGIAYAGDGIVLLSEENTPGVRAHRVSDGTAVFALPVPAVFSRGRRANLGFEALAADEEVVWTANEEALRMDGPRSTDGQGSLVRLLRFQRVAGAYRATAQYPYLTEPIHKPYSDRDGRLSRSGLVELVLLPDGRLLALERSFALFGPGNIFSDFRNSLFLIDVEGATDVSAAEFDSGLENRDAQPAGKRLVWSLRGLKIGNLEGLCLGPEVEPGVWVLVGVTDSGGMPGLVSRVIVFELRMEAQDSGQNP